MYKLNLKNYLKNLYYLDYNKSIYDWLKNIEKNKKTNAINWYRFACGIDLSQFNNFKNFNFKNCYVYKYKDKYWLISYWFSFFNKKYCKSWIEYNKLDYTYKYYLKQFNYLLKNY